MYNDKQQSQNSLFFKKLSLKKLTTSTSKEMTPITKQTNQQETTDLLVAPQLQSKIKYPMQYYHYKQTSKQQH